MKEAIKLHSDDHKLPSPAGGRGAGGEGEELTKARILRQAQTPTEAQLWQHLRNRRLAGCKFRRQHPIGPYIVDFVCLEKRLVIELDGSQHLEQAEYDAERTRYLAGAGLRVLRFWNSQLAANPEAVLAVIRAAVQ